MTIRTTLIGTAFLVAAALAPVTPAQAAEVGCNTESCLHQDPVAMGCTRDSWVIDEITVALPTSGPIRTRLQARYSPACNAAFAYVRDTTLVRDPDSSVRLHSQWLASHEVILETLPDGWMRSPMIHGRREEFHACMDTKFGPVECTRHSA